MRLVRSLTCISVALTGVLLSGQPAIAGVPQAYVNVSKPYVSNWVFRSTRISACMFVEVTGNVTATHRYAYYSSSGGFNPNYYVWYNVKMNNPAITMKTGSLTSIGCDFTRPVSFSSASLNQAWYEGGCALGVSIGAGFPWSVFATPTYSCGNHQVGGNRTSYGTSTSFKQYNTGNPVLYTGEKLAGASDALPFRANINVTGYRSVGGSAVSDTFATNGAVAYLKG